MDDVNETTPTSERSTPTEKMSDNPRTPVERMADAAREQATEAADALRKGEFMHDAALDAEATPDDRLIALLSYATQVIIPLVMPVIVLLSESSKTRAFQRYHAIQSIALGVLFGAGGIVLGVGASVLWLVPLIGPLISVLLACLIPIAWAMAVVAMLYYGYQAYQGKRFAIPGLTSFLRDQGWV